MRKDRTLAAKDCFWAEALYTRQDACMLRDGSSVEARQTVHVDDWTWVEVCRRQKAMHTANEWAEQAVGGGMH